MFSLPPRTLPRTDIAAPPAEIVKLAPPYKGLWVALDFDGTCVTHAYPEIGADIGSVPVLRRLMMEGAHLALWTMRSGTRLDEALRWAYDQELAIVAANCRPADRHWTSSPKMSADLYIDDRGLGVPLLYNKALSDRPYVDWTRLAAMLWPDESNPSLG